MMVGARFFAFGLLLSGCTHELEGAPCPCLDDEFQCCDGVCLPQNAACESALAAGGMSHAADPGGSGASGDGDVSSSPATGGAGATESGDAGSDAKAGDDAERAPLVEAPFSWVPTEHNDNFRTGANRLEPTLTVDSVKQRFRELSRRPLRGAVFAQPLVASRVVIDSQERDLLIAATMGNFVYGLDARRPEAAPLWVTELGPSILLPDERIEHGAGGITHEVGILSTPVLDPERQVLYVVAATKHAERYAHTLYALSLVDGSIKSSVEVAHVGFDSGERAQRSALTLANGVLYVPFGGYAAGSSMSGWVFAYDANLELLGAADLGRPDGGGVTMSGRGPVAVDGHLYFTVSRSGSGNAVSYSKLIELADTANTLYERLVPPFGPNELGSSGPLLIAASKSLFVAGQRHSYLVPQTSATFNDFTQELEAGSSEPCPKGPDGCLTEAGSPVYLAPSRSGDGARVFIWPAMDVLRGFQLDEGESKIACDAPSPRCEPAISATSADSSDAAQQPVPHPAHLSISSDEGAPGTSIVWAAQPYPSPGSSTLDGILRAFDADDLSQLWNSEQEEASLGPLAPGTLATVSGGKVFVGTTDGISQKHTFDQDRSGGPLAITSFGDRYLVLAWSIPIPETQGLHVTWSEDGSQFRSFNNLPGDPLAWEPALAADGPDRIFLAFTQRGNRIVAFSDAEPNFEERVALTERAPDSEPTPLSVTATTPPALAFSNGRLVMAWHDDEGLHLMSSLDGESFDRSTLVSFPGYTSDVAPSLQPLNGKLYLVTTSRERRMSLFVSSDDGAHFGAPTVLVMQSPGHPALFASNSQGDSPDLLVMWVQADADSTSGNLQIATSFDDSAFGRTHVLSSDQAETSISGVGFRGSSYAAWLGTDGAPNVARYSRGELVTYGLAPP